MRKVELEVDGFPVGVPEHDFEKAVGYLSTWAISGFPEVSIFRQVGSDEDLMAVYSNGPNKTYAIAAIWRKDLKKYTFHS
jgi:hypothetical protein